MGDMGYTPRELVYDCVVYDVEPGEQAVEYGPWDGVVQGVGQYDSEYYSYGCAAAACG